MTRFRAVFLLVGSALLPAQPEAPSAALMQERNHAWVLFGQGNQSQAIDLLQGIISRDRRFAPASLDLLNIYRLSKLWAAAENYSQELLEKDPSNGLAHLLLAEAYAALKNYSKADPHYLAWIRSLSQCPGCCEPRWLSAYAGQRLARAVIDMERLAASNPKSPTLHIALAEGYRRLLRAPDAVRVYRAGLPAAEATGNRRLRGQYLQYGALLVTSSAQDWNEGVTLLRRALPLFEQEQDDEGVRRSLWDLATYHRALGQLKEADADVQQLLARSQGNAMEEAAAYQAWAKLKMAAGDLPGAAEQFGRAAQIAEHGPPAQLSIDIASQLGTVRLFQGDFNGALASYRRSIELAEAFGDDFGAAYGRRLMGNAYGELGDHWRELEYHIRSLERFRVLNPHTAGAGLGSVGSAWSSLGDYDKAERYYRRALESAVRFNDGGEQQRHLANLGELALIRRDYRRAHQYLKRALALTSRAGEPRFQVGILIDLGDVFRHERRYRLAVESCARGLSLSRSLGIKNLESAALTTMGAILLDSGDKRAARNAYGQALAIGESFGMQDVIWMAQQGLGEVLKSESKLGEALQYFHQATRTLERIRSSIPSPIHKASFLEDKLKLYESIIEVLARLHQEQPGAGFDRDAFQYAEQSRARVFLETLAESRAKLQRELTPDQTIRQTSLLREYSRASAVLLDHGSPSARESLIRTEEKLELLVAEIRATNPKYARVIYPEPYTLAKAQAEAARQDVDLLVYSLGETGSLAWVINSNGSVLVRLAPRSVIEDQVLRYRRAISTRPRNERDLTAWYTLGRRLYRTVFEPVASSLRSRGKVVVIPDGILHYLPFETLVRPHAHGNRPTCIAHDFTIVYAPSAASVEYLAVDGGHSGPPPGMELLAYGDPDFGALRDRASHSALVRSVYASGGMHLPQLPRTRDEVLGIASFFTASRSSVRLGREASEGSLKRADLGIYRRIHFATHAVIDERVPSRSGVVLSLVNRDGEDGILQTHEILNLEMAADLVVLSACQTGLGHLVRGEGMIGLTRAFFYAGAQRVIVSLWEVNDASTSTFMKALYRNLRPGVTHSAALRAARLEMLDSPVIAYRHPYFWGPFVLVGRV